MKHLTIAGIGAMEGHLTREAERTFRSGAAVILQTERCYLSALLQDWGVPYETADGCYEQAEDYDELNERVAELVLSRAADDAVFAVPGCVRGQEMIAALLFEAKEREISVTILPGIGYGEAALAAAGLCEEQAARIVSATDVEELSIDPGVPLVIQEVDQPMIAAAVKLALMEYYPDEWEILLAELEETGYELRPLPLYELDRQKPETFLHTTCLIVPPVPFEQLSRRGVKELEELLTILRAPGGCPWDREQTIPDLRKSVLEEAYEVAEAIDLDDDEKLCEELGDLLMQVVMLSCIASEQGRFALRDVTSGICAKLIYRHPHVFGDAVANDSAAVLANWEQLKKAEKKQQTQGDVLRAVPKPLPALTRSAKIQKKAAQVGFDWSEPFSALDKVREETAEFEAELRGTDEARRAEEMGDLLFAAVNAARLSGIDPELALTRAAEKFTDRFCQMEEAALSQGKKLEEMTLEQMDELWNAVKTQEPKGNSAGKR